MNSAWNGAVIPLIAEMKAKAAIAEARGDELTVALCTQVMANVLPSPSETAQSPVPATARAALINAWGKHLAA